MTQEARTCQNCKKDFLIDSDDFTFYAKVDVPPPTFCHLCRAQRRFAWRNENMLFKRPEEGGGEDIFCHFDADSPVKTYRLSRWFSDEWDAMDYGREIDWSRPFFSQFVELLRAVPLKALTVVRGVNSDYVNNFTDPKNCYLVFNGKGAEDCMYGHGIGECRDCVDISHVKKCETCYEGFWLTECQNTHFSSNCQSSFDMWFCRDCVGCSDCFGSVGLRNKKYHIFNKPYSKEDYEKRIAEFGLSSYARLEEVKRRVREFWLGFPVKFMEGVQNTNVTGNYISNSKNVRDSFLVREGENLRYCQYAQEPPSTKDCYDYSVWGDANELDYECCACGIGTHKVKFSYNTMENSRDAEYAYMCHGSSNLFGCVGLRKKEYCIFNKQYSKEEYEELVGKIKKHMDEEPYTDSKGRVYKYGEFSPIELSPFAYNDTLAHEYFPLTKEEAEAEGYRWRDPAERKHAPTMEARELPESILDVEESITKEVIGCLHKGECNQQCTFAFKMLPQELQFYKKIGVSLPRLCPNCRKYERIAERTGLRLYGRKCACEGRRGGEYENTAEHFHGEGRCPNEFETAYSPDGKEIVYCEACYNAEVA